MTALRTFLAVCRLGSLTAAAAELGYTQSAVSRQLAALEKEVGTPLVTRRPRGVVPTSAGEAFQVHVRTVVAETDRAVRAARQAGAAGVPVALGATPSAAAGVVPASLRRIRDDEPDLEWSLVVGLSSDLCDRVATGVLDLAVVTDAPPGLPDDDRVSRIDLGTDEMCVIVPLHHPAADAAEAVPLADLAEETWVEDNSGSETLLRTAAARSGFEPWIELGAPDLTGKAAMVAAGHAIALVPGLLVPALRPDVAVVRLRDAPTRGIFAMTPVGEATRPVVADLVEALRLEVERLPTTGAVLRTQVGARRSGT